MLKAPQAFHAEISSVVDTSVPDESGHARQTVRISMFSYGGIPIEQIVVGRKVIVILVDDPVKPV